jgi:hypothetical protein
MTKRPTRGGGWRERKIARKAGHERTALRKLRQAKAARTRVGREGRRTKISSRRSSPMVNMVVGAGGGDSDGGGGGGGGSWEAIPS